MKHQWWHNKVAYQIYPKSFYDSNGDGIGDIRGIIEKLDYLKYLGVDIIWLSPVYKSPLADQGYDIADYYEIDPRFGTMEDMEELLREAKKREQYILMDLVVNHCSDEHEWFKKAMEDPDGEYGNFFYLADKKDGRPCNWRSYFGGTAWDDLPGTDKQYLHLFHKKQPDLNWENPRVREEVYRNINWWLEKGLAGFRIDAIINIKKALPMKDYPADRPDGLCSPEAMLKDAGGIGAFLGEMRDKTFKRYDAFTVGEVFNEKREELPDFIGENGYFSSMFDFNETVMGTSSKGWYDNRPVTAEEYKQCCFDAQERVGDTGFYSNVIENHDEPRGVSRYLPEGQVCEAGKKMLGGLNFMLRGLPFIYQGQEIGMENMEFTSIDQVDDISSIAEYGIALEAGLSQEEALKAVSRYSRDNARTPMQWDDGENAGFTGGAPWLNLNPLFREINVKEQMGREDSVLQFYRKLIALRKNPEYQDTVVYGQLVPFRREQENLMGFYRKGGDKTLLVLGNYQKEAQEVSLDSGRWKVLVDNMRLKPEDNAGQKPADSREPGPAGRFLEEDAVRLEGWQFLILERMR